MRERSTWNRNDIVKKASTLKVADPYTMNQDHPQPPADKYVTGDPSTFAEDVHEPNTWESEYANGQTKRDEIGLPDFRSDTFNHPEKTAMQKEILVKKANLCIEVAQLMFRGKKVATASIEDQAVALMHLPDQELISTHQRLAGEQDEDKDQDQSKQDQDQDQGDKDQDQVKQAQDQDQDQEEGQQSQSKQASEMQQLADQMQQMQSQLQQMMQQSQGQQQPQGQGQQQPQGQGQGQQQQPLAQGQQPQQQMQSDDQVLDQMLADDGCGQMSEMDIQMDPSQMDVGMDDLGPEDEALRSLFAQDDSDQDQDQGQAQQKQASIRTASNRTVGTRPTAGVSKLGGGAASAGSDNSIDQLSSLWKSAPDVRGAFGL